MISIRPLAAPDQPRWLRLWQGYQAFYETEIAMTTSEIVWQRLLAPTEPMYGALAFLDESCVGLVHYIQHRSCWTIGDYCYLQDLFVDPDARRGGIGRALIEHVYAEAEKRGCSRVYWLTHESNVSAMQLYDRIGDRSGFVQYRKLLEPRRKADQALDPGS
jgi:GNAT superfamily N-acetyltransferase